MVATYRLSNTTIQKALHKMKEDGLLVSRPGRGLFVADGPTHDIPPDTPELWVDSTACLGRHAPRLLNAFYARYPHIRLVEGSADSDVFQLTNDFVAQRAERLEDMTELALEVYGRSQEGAELFDPLRVNGRLYMLPLSLNVLMMACNVDVFESAGVPLPPEDWDWEDFVRISQALTRHREGIYGSVAYYHWDSFVPLVWQAGGALYSKDGSRCLLDSEEALEVGRHLRARAESAMPCEGITYEQVRDAFARGRVGMMTTGVWGYHFLNQARCRWVVRPLPRGRQRATWFSARGYGVSRRSRQRGLAAQFLRECAGIELWPDTRRLLPALPLHKELESNGQTERAFRKALPHARAWLSDIAPAFRRPIHSSALSVLERYVGPLVFGREPVGALMRNLTLEIEFLLSRDEERIHAR